MASEQQLTHLRQKAKAMRHYIIDMIGCTGGKVGHLGGSCSIVELVASLYFYKMNISSKEPKQPLRDRFILSKGHAALAHYAALCEAGFFEKEELTGVKCLGSMLQGHPDMNKTPGVEANTGSLGQGLSIGLGMALGLRLKQNKARVYVIIGDGELAEGQIWEAAMAASSYKADNLVAIVDNNKLQATGPIKERLDIGDIRAKWEAFGFHVIEIDGHEVSEICDALDAFDKISGKPKLLLAHTVKGKGVSFAEGKAQFHNSSLTKEQFEKAHLEIG